MALVDCHQPVYDRKVDQILSMLEDGIEREEIAKELGYKNPISLDNYMRRRNFSWDSSQKMFVPAAERYSARLRKNVLPLHGTSKAALIVANFARGEADPKEIAIQAGFQNHMDLANYMKRKGYEWDAEQGNYKKTKDEESPETGNLDLASGNVTLDDLLGLIKNLQGGDQGSLKAEVKAKDPPRFNVQGVYGTKAMRMVNTLDDLMRRYSEEKNLTQKEIVEIALIVFFQKYGYKDEVEEYVID